MYACIFRLYLLDYLMFLFFFFFSSRRRHTRYIGDWSSDVCSSDLSVCLRLVSAPDRINQPRKIIHKPLKISAVATTNKRPAAIMINDSASLTRVAFRVAFNRFLDRPQRLPRNTRRSEERRVGKEDISR